PTRIVGGKIEPPINRTVGLSDFFRKKKLPVAFTRVVYAEDGVNAGMFCLKAPNIRILTDSHPASTVVPELAPRAGELVIKKSEPSAFFGTGLAPWLWQQAC